jgi:hypothetical protein
MHAERDHLNRFVFPELRSRCLRLGWDFLGVDLRWGITEEDAEREGTLGLCLNEAERCRPFFLGLLGGRYGSVMAPPGIPAAIFERVTGSSSEAECSTVRAAYELDASEAAAVYRLRKVPSFDERKALARLWESHDTDRALRTGESITAQEIRYAALDPTTRFEHCFFYIRRLQPQAAAKIPDFIRRSFVEEHPAEQRKLEQLERQVRALDGKVVLRDYEADITGVRLDPVLVPRDVAPPEGRLDLADAHRWSRALRDAVERHSRIELSGMEQIGVQITSDLWTAIEAFIARTIPSGQVKTGAADSHYQEQFIRQRARVFVGREASLLRLFDYVGAGSRSALLVTGAPGSGKSALLANFALQCRERYTDATIASFFIGASPGSTSLHVALSELSRALLEIAPDVETLPADPLGAKRAFQSVLREAASRRRVIIVLDAVNQLEPMNSGGAAWFPFVLPPGVRLVASGAPGEMVDALRERLDSSHIFDLEDLTRDQCQALVRQHLALRQKRLPEDLIGRLLDDTVSNGLETAALSSSRA